MDIFINVCLQSVIWPRGKRGLPWSDISAAVFTRHHVTDAGTVNWHKRVARRKWAWARDWAPGLHQHAASLGA